MSAFPAPVDSPRGPVAVWTTAQGVAAVLFDDHRRPHRDRIVASLGDARPAEPQALGHDVVAALAAYFAGDRGALHAVPLDLTGTPLQRRVWAAVHAVRPGEHTTYATLAIGLGMVLALTRKRAGGRAVGAAVGRNPASLLVPCHRVLGARGELTGYAGGNHRKRWLLDHEAGQALLPLA